MFESLRPRLIAWYALTLVLVIGAFGATVCYLYWRSLLREIDLDLGARAAVVASVLRPAPDGTFDLELPPGMARDFGGPGDHVPYYAIWSAEGELVAASEPVSGDPPPTVPATRTRAGFRETVLASAGGVVVLVGRDAGDARREVWSLAGTVAGVGAVALALSLVGGWFLAGRALAPIARISRTAAAMSGGDLAARIPLEGTESELEQVAVSLNAAFDQLEEALRKEQQFVADASHELRTPLATLWTEAEWSLARTRTGDEYRRSLEICLAVGKRIAGVVGGLLTLARADAGEAATERIPVGLKAVAEEAVALLRPVAERRQIAVTVRGDDVMVAGDADRLREMISNLVSNAIGYNVDGGAVDVVVSATDGARLTVSDTGVGIAAADLSHVFDRFYRADPARTRNSGGAGLGLAVAKSIAESHRGSITCSSGPGQGTTVEVRFERAAG